MVSQIRNIRFDVVSIKKKLLALEKSHFPTDLTSTGILNALFEEKYCCPSFEKSVSPASLQIPDSFGQHKVLNGNAQQEFSLWQKYIIP